MVPTRSNIHCVKFNFKDEEGGGALMVSLLFGSGEEE
jgi:hypothetical protein